MQLSLGPRNYTSHYIIIRFYHYFYDSVLSVHNYFFLAREGYGYTVPLKGKLPVSSRFSRDESRVSRDEIFVSRDATLVSRYENLVSRESLKRKFWNITKFLVRRKPPSFSRTCLVMRLSVPFLKRVPTCSHCKSYVIRNNFVFIQFKGFDSCTM